MLQKLGSSLRDSLSKLKSSMFIDETLINDIVRDIQRALLQSDANVRLVLDLSKRIKERAKEPSPKGISKRDYLIKIVYEELTTFLGEESIKIELTKKPTTLMLIGLFGSGKTTTTAKLAKFYKKRGHKVAVIETDTWRPAAYDQLQQTSEQIGVDFYGDKTLKDPTQIYLKFESQVKDYDIVIVDTAGRDRLSDELVKELTELNNAVNADHRILVLSGDIGQGAEKQAQMFHETCNVTGIVLTKMEGTAKGGGALSACHVTGAGVLFLGVGEKLDDLEEYHPQRFVGRLLGMGDLETLLERAHEVINEEKAEDLQKRFQKGNFDLNDLYEQMKALKSMGSLGKIMEMIPGMSSLKLPKEALDVQEGKLQKWKYAIDSMTPYERSNPDCFNSNRVDRVAAGAGMSIREIRDLLKQYKQSKKMMKMFNGEQDVSKLMQKMKGKRPF
jgi:signal recognition particle subunit SRP54